MFNIFSALDRTKLQIQIHMSMEINCPDTVRRKWNAEKRSA